MSDDALQIIIGVVLALHGLAHSMGILVGAKLLGNERWHSHSHLITGLIGDHTARSVAIAIWLVALLGFVGAGLGAMEILIPNEMWRPMAIFSALLSMVGLALFWGAFVHVVNKLIAIAINLAIIVLIIVLNWPSRNEYGF